MKKLLLPVFLLTVSFMASGQAIIDSWIMNANGKKASYWANNGGNPPTYTFMNSADSADVLKVCYNSDTVWMRSQNMTNDMGKWFNPGSAVAQNWVHRFPRNPTVPLSKTISPKVGEIGMLINGIAIYGLSNAASWSGTANSNPQQGGKGIWNVEVGLSEGFVLDTAFGAHPQQQGVYHSHTTPFRLYKNIVTTKHSPIIGWAFDGNPIYGPYGYTSPMDSGSAVIRMKTGYSLRNITTRTTLPGGSAASQAGPAVNTTYPLGTYIEDYEWLLPNGGDLDEFNGRVCITPEFPNGTYAYFVTMDAAGKAEFPYYIGIYYYGQPDGGNFPAGPNGNGLTIPSYLSSCKTPGSVPATGIASVNGNDLPRVYPNPSDNGDFIFNTNGRAVKKITVLNALGMQVFEAGMTGRNEETIRLAEAKGMYLLYSEEQDGIVTVSRLMIR